MKKAVRSILKKLTSDKNGATAIEYGLIACGISLAIVSVVFLFGDELQELYAALVPAAEAIAENVETSR